MRVCVWARERVCVCYDVLSDKYEAYENILHFTHGSQHSYFTQWSVRMQHSLICVQT